MRALLPFVLLTLAAAPPNADPALSDWFKSLHSPDGVSCCNIADCRAVSYRTINERYEVFLDKQTFGSTAPDAWVPVPDTAALTRENPTGSAIACVRYNVVHCFVRSSET